jgi:adenosylhomocysteine nucleosidase
MPKQLLVFAHADEASAFADVPHLVTGVGKINASVHLAFALSEAERAGDPVNEVLVLGTAGIVADSHDLATIVQVDEAVQYDFSLPSPTLRFGSPTLDERARVATGDQFVKDNRKRQEIAELGASLCDMEAYAYAALCAKFQVPLRIFKIPSDFANSATTDQEWDEIVFLKSQQLRAFYNNLFA